MIDIAYKQPIVAYKQPAIGNINTIVYTKKTEFVMGLSSVDYPIMIYHGSTGNGKSMTSTLKFMVRIFNSSVNHQTYVLAGRDIQSLERRFVESNMSVLNWFPFKGKWVYKKQGVGGSRIIVSTPTGKKFIYLTPFNNITSYSRILGETINGIMVDEAVESDELFLQEMVVRINRTRGTWGIFTSNGGDPNHYFYTHMINRSTRIEELIDGVIPTPEEEIRYYDKEGRKENYITIHMGLEDNPVYDTKQLKDFYDLYPAGSFMFNSRILGVRGFTQNAPFSPYMNAEIFIKYEELVEKGFNPDVITYSVDVGGHVFADGDINLNNDMFGEWHGGYRKGEHGTTAGGHTIMLTIGWSKRYKRALLIDTYFPNHMHDHINVERLNQRVYNIGNKFGRASKPFMFSDAASPGFLSLLRDSYSGIKGVGQIRPAIKRDTSINLDEKEAIALIQQYMMKGNFAILDTPSNRKYFYDSMVQASLESDGKLIDNRKEEADIQDALKYEFTSMYRMLIRE